MHLTSQDVRVPLKTHRVARLMHAKSFVGPSPHVVVWKNFEPRSPSGREDASLVRPVSMETESLKYNDRGLMRGSVNGENKYPSDPLIKSNEEQD
ncbi:hypothetical protein TNCV_1391321 [Trichonephila clavipes]|nr:hypothetical protein TNCV_1391321 [Trichonephila clavipes]